MRRLVLAALAALILTLLLLPSTAPRDAARAGEGGDPKWTETWEGFPHWRHVHTDEQVGGNGAKVRVDTNDRCTECHDTARAPKGGAALRGVAAEACERCHEPGREVARFETETVKATVMMLDFDHRVHFDEEKIECSLCHTLERLNGAGAARKHVKNRGNVFADHWAVPTIARCRSCHEKHDTSLPRHAPASEDEACARCHAEQVIEATPKRAQGNPDAPKAFSHAQHLGGVDGAADISDRCVACHQGARESTRLDDGSLHALTEAVCFATCHEAPVAESGEAMAFDAAVTKNVANERYALPEFGHADHASQRCDRCHTLGANDVFGWSDEAKGLPGYAGCVGSGCHGGGQDDRRVEAHEKAKEEGPMACRRCHTGNPNPQLRGELIQVQVTKRRLGPVTYGESAHPYVCADGKLVETAAQCRDCHRRLGLPIESRIAAKPFDHDLHFPPPAGGRTDEQGARRPRDALPSSAAWTANPEGCAGCHRGIEASGDAQTSHLVDLAAGEACARCHIGDPPALVAPNVRPEEKVWVPPGFSHARHVNDEISCKRCHAWQEPQPPAKAGGAPRAGFVLVVPTRQLCKECHDHQTGGPGFAVTGPSALGKCNFCHTGESIFLAGTEPRRVARWSSATVKARLGRHHRDYEGACNRCHVRVGPDGEPKGFEVEREVVGRIVYEKFEHPPAPKGTLDDVQRWCLTCHIKRRGQKDPKKELEDLDRDERGE